MTSRKAATSFSLHNKNNKKFKKGNDLAMTKEF